MRSYPQEVDLLTEEWIVREFGMDRYTLLYLKWITKKGLLCPLLYREFCSMLGGSLDGRGD